MKLRSMVAAVMAAGTLVAVPTAVTARPVHGPLVVAAGKHCPAAFTPGKINGRWKCLHAGEFCTHRFDRRAPHRWSYRHYGFRCTKYYPNVQRYRLTYA